MVCMVGGLEGNDGAWRRRVGKVVRYKIMEKGCWERRGNNRGSVKARKRVSKNMKGTQGTAGNGTGRMGWYQTAGKKVERWVHCMPGCVSEDCMC